MNTKNRLFAILLALAMVITYMPELAYAVGEQPEETPSAEEILDSQETAGDDSLLNEEEGQKQETEAVTETNTPDGEDNVDTPLEPDTATDKRETARKVIITPSAPEAQKVIPEVVLDDGLLLRYVDKRVEDQTKGTKGRRSAAQMAGANLSAEDLKVYKALIPEIKKIASGNRADTEISINLIDIFGDEAVRKKYRSEDLDVLDLVVPVKDENGQIATDEQGNEIYQLSQDAEEFFWDSFSFDFGTVLEALITDCPYEFYWFDKSYGASANQPLIGVFEDEHGEYLSFSDTDGNLEENPVFNFAFYVSADYSESGEAHTTKIKEELPQAVSTAASNIANIIETHKTETDYDKLVSYKDEIIGLTDYNNEVNEETLYGDPWQLIFVFDENPDTKVVCEGYSKAFQYLCDNTTFKNSKIDCYTVTGKTNNGQGAGPHMWNILHMENGKNYIADITNSDEKAAGYINDTSKDADKSYAFLNGYKSGDVYSGYVYSFGDSDDSLDVLYEYDDNDERSVWDIFTNAQLRMSSTDYEAGENGSTGDYIYYYEDDKDLLIDEHTFIPNGGWVENTKTKDFARYDVTNVEIINETPDSVDSEDGVVSVDAEEDGWDITADGLGAATLKITYLEYDSETEASYTLTINVSEEVYKVYIENEGSDNALPGETVTLKARCVMRYYDYETDYVVEDEIEDMDMIRWNLEGDGDSFAQIVPVEDTATITFKNQEDLSDYYEDGELWRGIQVTAGIYSGNSLLASSYRVLQLKNDFYEIEPVHLPELDRYVPETVEFKLMHRSMDSQGTVTSDNVEGAEFNWVDYDEEGEDNPVVIELAESSNNAAAAYSLTRVDEEDISLSLSAQSDEGSSYANYDLGSWDDEIEIEYDDDMLYSDADAVFTIKLEGLKNDWQTKYRLVATAGEVDPETDEFVGDAHSSDIPNSGCILQIEESGKKAIVTVDKEILEVYENKPFEVYAELKPLNDSYREYVATYYGVNMEVTPPIEEYRGLPEKVVKGLPDSGWTVWENGGYLHRENSSGTSDVRFVVNNVEIIGSDPEETSAISINKEDDPGNCSWDIHADAVGSADVRITGRFLDKNDELISGEAGVMTYDCTFNIVSDIYQVNIDSEDGKYRGLPGDIIELTVANRYEHNSINSTENDELSFTWTFDEGGEFAEFVDDEGNTVSSPTGESVRVKFNELQGDEDEYHESVNVRVAMSNNGEEVADDSIELEVASEYAELLPLRLTEEQANTPVGSTIVIEPSVMYYSIDNPEGETIGSGSNLYFWDDASDVDLSVESSGYGADTVFEVTRLTDDDIEFKLKASWMKPGEEEVGDFTEQHYHFNRLEAKEIRFNSFTDRLFSNATKELSLDMSEFGDAWADDYAIEFKVGTWDYEKESFDELFDNGYSVDESEPTSLLLDGAAIWSKFGNEAVDTEFAVLAEVWSIDENGAHIGDEPVCSTRAVLWAEEAITEYKRDDAILMLGWDMKIDKIERARVRDATHNDTEEPYEVLNVTTDDENVLSVVKKYEDDDINSNNYWWVIKAENHGSATVEVTHMPYTGDGDPLTYTFEVDVVDEMYEADIINKSGNGEGLPGDEFSLSAFAIHRIEGQQDITEGFTFMWEIDEDDSEQAWFVDKDGNKINAPETKDVTLKFGNLPEERNDADIDISLHVFDGDNEVKIIRRAMHLTNSYITLVWDGIDPDMDVGDSDVTTLNLVHRAIGCEDEVLNAQFAIQSEGDVTVSDENNEGNRIISRTGFNEARIRVSVEYTDDHEHTYNDNREYDFPARYYRVWLEEAGGLGIRDDEEKTFEFHLDGFEKLIKESQQNGLIFDVSVLTAEVMYDDNHNEIEYSPSDEDIYTLDNAVKETQIDAENNKLFVTIDGSKIPSKAGPEGSEFDVERISINVAATRSVSEEISENGKVTLFADEGIGRPIFVTRTCVSGNHTYSELIPQVEATCTTDGMQAHYICTECGALFIMVDGEYVKKTEAELKIPAHHTLTAHAANAATCTEPGNLAYWECSVCEKYFLDDGGNVEVEPEDIVVPAGHKYGDLITQVDATCTTNGTLAHYKCSECNKLFVMENGAYAEKTAEELVIPAGHNYGELIAQVNATCTQDGMLAHYECSGCDKLFVKDGDEYVEKTETELKIPAAHDYGELIAQIDATCITDGMQAHYKCSKCNKLFVKEDGEYAEKTEAELKIPAHHTLTAHAAVAKTCTADGNSAYWSCDACGKYFSDAAGKNEIDENAWVIPAGHNYGELIAQVNATCTQDGMLAHYECSGCDKLFVKDGDEYVEKTADELIIAKGHTLTAHTAVAKTCTADGNSAYWSCSVCGKYFSDAACEHEINENAWVIPAGHNYGELIAQVDATCTTDGTLAHYKCSGCDKLFVKDGNEYVEKTADELKIAKGHTLTAHAAVDSTCTTAGNSAYWSCDRCGKYFSDENGTTEIAANNWVTPALGHELGQWTRYDDNNHIRECLRDGCDHTETAAHNWDGGVVSDPGNDHDPRERTYTCADCGAQKTDSVQSRFDEAKDAALAELGRVNPNDYSGAERTAVENAIAAAREAIENTAETVADINAAKNTALSTVRAQKTNAQKNAEAVAAARDGVYDGSIPGMKNKKPKASKRAITVKWTKFNKKKLKSSGATNYEIWVCSDGAFANGSTIERVVGKKKSSLKIKGLTKGVTYYTKVRAIKYVGGAKVVGPWSAVKAVKVKK